MSATAIILGLVAIVVGVFAAVVKTLITDEVKAWLPHASTKLVNKAVDLLPPEHQERWREEWQADLVEYLEDERRLAGLQYSVQALRAAAAMRKTLRPQLDRLPADRVLVAIYVRRRGLGESAFLYGFASSICVVPALALLAYLASSVGTVAAVSLAVGLGVPVLLWFVLRSRR